MAQYGGGGTDRSRFPEARHASHKHAFLVTQGGDPNAAAGADVRILGVVSLAGDVCPGRGMQRKNGYGGAHAGRLSGSDGGGNANDVFVGPGQDKYVVR